MHIEKISVEKLRTFKDKEGLVFQSWGVRIEDWIDHINDILTKEGVLLDGIRLETCYTFLHGHRNCAFLEIKDEKIDKDKLNEWVTEEHERLGVYWLTDYVPIYFVRFFDKDKLPKQSLISPDGKIFKLMATAAQILKDNDMFDRAKEMCNRVRSSASEEDARSVIREYVDFTENEEEITCEIKMGEM